MDNSVPSKLIVIGIWYTCLMFDPHPIQPDGSPHAVDEPVASAHAELDSVRASLARLRRTEWWRIGDQSLLELARVIEEAGRSLAGLGVRLTGELVERGTANTLGARTPAGMLHGLLNVPQADARARVRIAQACLARKTPTGVTIEPAVPEAIDALDQGSISADHAAVIVDTVTWIPAAVDERTRTSCRNLLLRQAQIGDVVRLKRVAEQIRQIIDPDGNLDGRDPVDRMEFHLGQRRRDGLTPIRGLLDQLTTETLRQAIEPLAAPQPIDDKIPDPRPAALRRAQALAEVLSRYLRVGKGPREGGVHPQVVVTIPLDNLRDRVGSAWADYGGPIPAAIARRLACDADIIPQVLNSESVVLDQGRAVRLFPPTSVGPSRRETGGVHSRLATSRRRGATPTTSIGGKGISVLHQNATAPCSAVGTTPSSIRATGRSAWPETAAPSTSHPRTSIPPGLPARTSSGSSRP